MVLTEQLQVSFRAEQAQVVGGPDQWRRYPSEQDAPYKGARHNTWEDEVVVLENVG